MKFIKSQFTTLILNNVRLFKWQSIFVKYVTIITVFLIIPSIILVLIFNYNISKTSFLSTSDLTLNNFDNAVQSCNNICSSLYDSNHFKSYFFSYDEDVVTENINNIYSTLTNVTVTNPYYDSVYIYDKQRNYVITLNGSSYYDRFYDIECFEKYDTDSSIVYRQIDRINNTYPVITIYHKIMFEGVDCGLIAVNINARLLSELLFKDSETVDFVNNNGVVVFSSNTEKIGQYKYNIDDFKNNDMKIKNQNMVYINTLSSCNMYMISSAPILKFPSPIQALGLVFLIIICCAAVAFIITMQYYTVISKILSITNDPYDIKGGSISEHTNELTIIAGNISKLQKENKNMELDLARQISLVKNSQMIALYTQINPHFIFNTLQLISLLAMKDAKQDTDLTRIIHKFSNMLRTTLDTKTYFVSVNEEMEITENFIEIINMRYKNKFSVIYEIDDNAKSHTILKFSLQPLIENAINMLSQRKPTKIVLLIQAYTRKKKIL